MVKFPHPSAPKSPRYRALTMLALPLFAPPIGCGRDSKPPAPTSVVIYTSVDQRFARDVLARFERDTGIRVDLLPDTEAGKTTGFLHRLQREAARPRCDVWWSSEVFGTIELARAGILEPYQSPAAADIPPAWKDARHRWTALAARARVLAFNTQRLRREELPATWGELAAPAWASRLVIANPQFGTTRGHLAAMFATWGREPTDKFLQALRDAGAQVADGNAHAVRLVASGAADLCLTDTDDVWVARQRGEPIDLVYPRLIPEGPIVWIPCSVARIRGGPNPAAARQLIDFLVSPEAERALAESDSRNVPVRADVRKALGLTGPAPEPLDFERVADALPQSTRLARDILLK